MAVFNALKLIICTVNAVKN